MDSGSSYSPTLPRRLSFRRSLRSAASRGPGRLTTYTLDDTIVAISTPIGQGGIGIVRLSGPDALEIARVLFEASDGAWGNGIEPNRLYHGQVCVPDSGRRIDEVLLSYMRAPRSYTRQDVVEINAHGGIVALGEILRLCLAESARMAHEGEFTLRAFLNGRIDLAQAEAVLDIIRAKTDASLRVAVDQLGGRLSSQVREIRAGLLHTLAYLEASIDFGDDVPIRDLAPELTETAGQLQDLLRDASRGMILRQGVRAAIVGRPNVGKSSLLNALLRADRAIVTPIPGTTRDTLEETISLEGIPVVLVDTAGIGQTDGVIERLGIDRSERAAARADLLLVVVDGSASPSKEDHAVAALAGDRPAVVVLNKCDLAPASDYIAFLPDLTHVATSALTGEGIPRLEAFIAEAVFAGGVPLGESPISSNPRHRDLFRRAHFHVEQALSASESGIPEDMVTIDVREAVHALGEVTGEMASEDLLDTIFADFCIGK